MSTDSNGNNTPLKRLVLVDLSTRRPQKIASIDDKLYYGVTREKRGRRLDAVNIGKTGRLAYYSSADTISSIPFIKMCDLPCGDHRMEFINTEIQVKKLTIGCTDVQDTLQKHEKYIRKLSTVVRALIEQNVQLRQEQCNLEKRIAHILRQNKEQLIKLMKKLLMFYCCKKPQQQGCGPCGDNKCHFLRFGDEKDERNCHWYLKVECDPCSGEPMLVLYYRCTPVFEFKCKYPRRRGCNDEKSSLAEYPSDYPDEENMVKPDEYPRKECPREGPRVIKIPKVKKNNKGDTCQLLNCDNSCTVVTSDGCSVSTSENYSVPCDDKSQCSYVSAASCDAYNESCTADDYQTRTSNYDDDDAFSNSQQNDSPRKRPYSDTFDQEEENDTGVVSNQNSLFDAEFEDLMRVNDPIVGEEQQRDSSSSSQNNNNILNKPTISKSRAYMRPRYEDVESIDESNKKSSKTNSKNTSHKHQSKTPRHAANTEQESSLHSGTGIRSGGSKKHRKKK